MEPEVDEKFYLNSDRAKKLIEKITASPEILKGGDTENRIKAIGHLGTGGQKGWVFNANGISRCLAATDYKDPTKIVETKTMIKITEPVICASRGRNPADLSDRGAGAYTEQHLEPKNDGTSNTLTTVQKDNLLLEPAPKILQIGNLIPDAGRKFTNPQTGRVYDPQELGPTLNTAQGGPREVKIIEATPEAYRIRKLTPRECYRLMGFTDAEFDRIKGVSNTQLYKQAGNSIVVNVLEAIFKQLPI